MFKDNTVFVVGAGASAEFGLPVGSQLMNKIKQNSLFTVDGYVLSSGIEEIYRCIVSRYTAHDDLINERLAAMHEINRAIDFAGSIDEFINRHSDDPAIAEAGKLQIAYAISEAERFSYLALMAQQPEAAIGWDTSDTWLHTFTQLLFDGVKNGDVRSLGENITIICFNYDRCIELFLQRAIVKSFRNISPDEALEIVERINIIHPYGSLGSLRDHPFAIKAIPQQIRQMSDNIVTWSESQRRDVPKKIKKAVMNASTVVFLGFAFAPQNMKLLTIDDFLIGEPDIETFATAYGYDEVIDSRLKSKILDIYSGANFTINSDRVHIQYNMECGKFMKAHSMALVV